MTTNGLFIAILICFHALAAAADNVCVLLYERAAHPFTKHVHKVFDSHSSVRIVEEALPIDIVKCIADQFDEIVIIAHSVQMGEGSEHVTMGYFRQLEGEEKTENLTKKIDLLQYQLEQLKLAKTSKQDNKLNAKINQKQRQIRKWTTMSPEKPLYVLRPFVNRIFEAARDELDKQAQSGGIALKKIRLVACDTEAIVNQYPAFKEIVDSFSIELDIAPKNRFLSWLKRRPVSSLNKSWLRESLD